MFQALRWRLLFSYLSVMVAILGTSTTAVYQFISHNLYQRIDRQMLTLADAAAHNLPQIKADKAAIYHEIPRIFDNDGDLDIPWQDLRAHYQSVEWFDAKGQLLGKAGTQYPETPFVAKFGIVQQGDIRRLTTPVYPHGSGETSVQPRNFASIQGYIRVSESTEALEAELNRLLWGLSWGGLIALTLTGVGGWWLTKQSLKPIEQNFQQMKQFTADASHELRSPLTALKTFVELMINHPERIEPTDMRKLQRMASVINQMTRLIEDLLFLARIDAASTNPVFERVSIPLDELLEDLVDLLQPQAEARGIALKLEASDEVFIKGNADELKRLFYNLLENALQYTVSSGNVTVSIVRCERFVVINVRDTGIGIQPLYIPMVFNRFWRASKARGWQEGGSGLGLAIAQAIAQRHGGEITVNSQVNVGSCFQVRLPVVC